MSMNTIGIVRKNPITNNFDLKAIDCPLPIKSALTVLKATCNIVGQKHCNKILKSENEKAMPQYNSKDYIGFIFNHEENYVLYSHIIDDFYLTTNIQNILNNSLREEEKNMMGILIHQYLHNNSPNKPSSNECNYVAGIINNNFPDNLLTYASNSFNNAIATLKIMNVTSNEDYGNSICFITLNQKKKCTLFCYFGSNNGIYLSPNLLSPIAANNLLTEKSLEMKDRL